MTHSHEDPNNIDHLNFTPKDPALQNLLGSAALYDSLKEGEIDVVLNDRALQRQLYKEENRKRGVSLEEEQHDDQITLFGQEFMDTLSDHEATPSTSIEFDALLEETLKHRTGHKDESGVTYPNSGAHDWRGTQREALKVPSVFGSEYRTVTIERNVHGIDLVSPGDSLSEEDLKEYMQEVQALDVVRVEQINKEFVKDFPYSIVGFQGDEVSREDTLYIQPDGTVMLNARLFNHTQVNLAPKELRNGSNTAAKLILGIRRKATEEEVQNAIETIQIAMVARDVKKKGR